MSGPSPNPADSSSSPVPPASAGTAGDEKLSRTGTRASVSAGSGPNASLFTRFVESAPPSGMWSATGEAVSKAPSLAAIRQGSFSYGGWNAEGQLQRRRSSMSGEERRLSRTSSVPQTPRPLARTASSGLAEDSVAEKREQEAEAITATESRVLEEEPGGPLDESATDEADGVETAKPSKGIAEQEVSSSMTPSPTEHVYANGYKFPPKHTWGEATLIGLKSFWRFALTPLGFLIVIYGLNVVAWGGMLFLLLCNASPAMCYPTCNDINSPRRIWIEIDSQILNALFCVTGFGLIPWRFRDFYYLLKYRIQHDPMALRRLGGVHNGWFRLPGSDKLDPLTAVPEGDEDSVAVPYPVNRAPNAPLTGERAPPTATWRLDYVIWLFVLNTALQAVLSGFMWGYNRYQRPSWSTGLFVALACIVAGAAGFMQFQEGKKVKRFEGVPVAAGEVIRDVEQGVQLKKEEKEKKREEKAEAGGKKGVVGLGLFPRKKHNEEVTVA
ncbi:MAG: hypothetical protein M1838_006125 [Thelocarpon superellum]|nr:MAG: hypothetical protein M1838_006125 [Thelocarpon superellum]